MKPKQEHEKKLQLRVLGHAVQQLALALPAPNLLRRLALRRLTALTLAVALARPGPAREPAM
jgi:hypothetical protein